MLRFEALSFVLFVSSEPEKENEKKGSNTGCVPKQGLWGGGRASMMQEVPAAFIPIPGNAEKQSQTL